MDRSAPAVGYKSNRKNLWRRQVWNVVTREAEVKKWSALLMPSIEGHEIDIATEKGFKQSQLHVVDRNPAIMAHIKRRYPRVTTYGVTVGRACERIAKQGIKLSFANLDFCGCLGKPLISEMDIVRRSGALKDTAMVGVTMLRGRETARTLRMLRLTAPALRERGGWQSEHWAQADQEKLNDMDIARIWVCAKYLDGLFPLRAGVYKSPNGCQTMLWCVMLVQIPKTEDIRAHNELMRKRLDHYFETGECLE